MSSANFFSTEKKAVELRTKNITTSATVTTYTAKVNAAAFMNGVVDKVINVTTAASCDITITVPDGAYAGQTVLINFLTEGSAETVTVAATTGSGGDSTMQTAGMYMYLMWTNSTTGWVAVSESVTS